MKQVGDRVRSTNINATPVTVIEGTVIEVEGREDDDGNVIEVEWLHVKQDDGKIAWWSA